MYRYIKILFLFFCCLALTSCRQTSQHLSDERVQKICSDIIDASVHSENPISISKDCLDELHSKGNPGGSYDTKVLNVESLYSNETYICICDATYYFNNTLNTMHFIYKISFNYDNTQNLVSYAEVSDYAYL